MTRTQSILLAISGAAIIGAVILRKRMKQETVAPSTGNRYAGDGYYPNLNYASRGYRNNNPLNINISKTQWQGQITPSGDKRFCQFQTMAYGYRAAMRNIRTYILGGTKTVEQIISKWAPAEDNNNTVRYISNVCNYTGFSPNTVIDYKNKSQMTKLVSAMSLSENLAKDPLPSADIENGYKLYIASI